jgi:hypothetical protein
VKPDRFDRHGEEFLAAWDTPGIAISFSRIRETDSGMLFAELDVQSTRPDERGTLLSPSRFNLMAATERKRLAEVLSQRAEAVPWPEALEAACGRIVREWRTPEPLVDLWDVPDPGENTYLLHPYLVENDTNLWYADEQSLKSYLAMVCAASIVSGRVVPSLGQPSKQGPVLLYDWETFGGKQRRRLTRVANGMGTGAVRQIHYRRMTRSITECIGLIRAEASRLGAVLVIFDSLGWMCNGDVNKSEIALPVMNAVGSIAGVTRLVLAHHSKAGRGDTEAPTVMGSGFFEAASRNRWLIRKAQDEGADTVRIGLYHRKASDDQRFNPRALAFTFDRFRDSVTVNTCDLEDDPALLKDAGPADRIVAVLRDAEFYKATVKEIAKETNIPTGSVKRHLLAMEGERVQRVSPNGFAGGRGHAAEWALLAAKPFTPAPSSDMQDSEAGAPETVQINRSPLTPENVNGFSPLRGETVPTKPFKSVHVNTLGGFTEDGELDELPF